MYDDKQWGNNFAAELNSTQSCVYTFVHVFVCASLYIIHIEICSHIWCSKLWYLQGKSPGLETHLGSAHKDETLLVMVGADVDSLFICHDDDFGHSVVQSLLRQWKTLWHHTMTNQQLVWWVNSCHAYQACNLLAEVNARRKAVFSDAHFRSTSNWACRENT